MSVTPTASVRSVTNPSSNPAFWKAKGNERQPGPTKALMKYNSAAFFDAFANVSREILENILTTRGALNILKALAINGERTYGEAKSEAEDYQNAKREYSANAFPSWPSPDASMWSFSIKKLRSGVRRTAK